MSVPATGFVEVPLSKVKALLGTLFASAFVALGLWLGSGDDWLRVAAGVAFVGFFGLCGLWGFVKLFDARPGLVIDSDGIIDNSSAVAVGRIPWSDIVGLEVDATGPVRFVMVELAEPEKYIERCGPALRFVQRQNLHMGGSPVNISAARWSFDRLAQALSDGFDRYKDKKLK